MKEYSIKTWVIYIMTLKLRLIDNTAIGQKMKFFSFKIMVNITLKFLKSLKSTLYLNLN